ncbi:hypothetical protein [Shinella sp. NM-101]|uniref:hypothetical protein n=1 Tax=Shinella sp. NM-101 TaxID=2744455 RepID=UPI001F44A6B9|nr:hypothetical protein [Shinella sp. NM-101]
MKKFRGAELLSIMVYFRLNRSMQVYAPWRGLAPEQKTGEVFFCNNNAGRPPLSPSPAPCQACLRAPFNGNSFALRRPRTGSAPCG